MQAAPNNPTFVLGEPLGTDRIRLRVTLGGGGSFTGTFVSEARDQAGVLMFTASGSVEGTRIQVE